VQRGRNQLRQVRHDDARRPSLLLLACATGTIVAPPFSGLDTLPALGVVIICLAIILEDVLVLAIGSAIGAGGIALILTIGAAIAHFLSNRF